MSKEYHLKTPLAEDVVRQLKVGDIVYLSGIVVTARDEAHKMALEKHRSGEPLPINFGEVAVYHCGPIIKKENDEWKVIAAGPTTSARMEIFEYDFIRTFRTRMIIGKGGMGEKTTKACKEFGAVYVAFTGGAAILAANAIKKVKNVYWLEELGMPEALWVFEVDNFGPLIVTIDSHGNNLFIEVSEKVKKNKELVYKMLGV